MMQGQPPDVWAAFLGHHAEGGRAINCRKQAITLIENRVDLGSMSEMAMLRQLAIDCRDAV